MTHATAEEIHDHAYGFRPSEHVADCAECGRASDAVAAERDVLRSVMEEEAPEIPQALLERPLAALPARRRIAPAALAAAALLVAALIGALLWQPSADRRPADPPIASQESEITRLIGELKSPSPLRKKIARLALMKYGGAALEALVASKADQNLVEVIRGETDDGKALLARMKTTRITFKSQGVYTEAFRVLESQVGKIRVDLSGYELETALINLDLENVTVYEVFEKISAQMKLPFGVQSGTLIIGKQPEPLALAPLRIMTRRPDALRRIADLSSDVPATREDAVNDLRRMGFGAEPALWEALNAASLETQSRASALLHELYGAVQPPEVVPAGPVKNARVTLETSNTPVQDAIADVLRQGGNLPLIWDSSIVILEELVSCWVKSISPEDALRLLLQPRRTNCVFGLDIALVRPGVASLSTPSPRVLWLKPALAGELESLIADLASTEPARQQKAARRFPELDATSALDALAGASWSLQGDALRRCQRLRRSIAAGQGLWFNDIPSGSDLQPLAPAQRALLDARVALPASDPLTLEELLKRDGVRSAIRTPVAGSYRGMGGKPTRSSLLKIVLRPEGLDFYLDGDTIVIDTAERVQAAVEK